DHPGSEGQPMIQYVEKLPPQDYLPPGLVALVFPGTAYLTWANGQDASAKLAVDRQLDSANRTCSGASIPLPERRKQKNGPGRR
ncbi:MAG: hypothetical protein Q7R39_17465, partial [Dehalococcoidia bacterium]|nr:hypothetical protein [Dehalococcoidia bacterium]